MITMNMMFLTVFGAPFFLRKNHNINTYDNGIKLKQSL